MADKIKKALTVLQQTIEFDASGNASVNVPSSNVLVAVCDTGDWDVYIPWKNNYQSSWYVKNLSNPNSTRTLKLYVMGG